ncbi:hypothetical protein [Streptomyces agglomeratus]|uniref:hypothetical protein n=1 Tax=Streptomyces agglomeratus TaxID=285458 RepID=UPI000854FCC5|nr:hypothetical protein [Streptomyces agglomeratus]OEJ36283.1 hypothetical protein BGK72_38635 [Streptomyces agglomeratus]
MSPLRPTSEVGRYRTVDVALYRLGNVRNVRDMPAVDWEAAHGFGKDVPSPLHKYAKLAPPAPPR